MNSTLDAFTGIGSTIQNDILGSPILYALLIIGFFILLILISKMNLKIGLTLILPVVFGILGSGGVNVPLIGGEQYQWILVMFIIMIATGGLATIYWRITQ